MVNLVCGAEAFSIDEGELYLLSLSTNLGFLVDLSDFLKAVFLSDIEGETAYY